MKGFVIAYVVFFSAVIINSVWACEDLAGTDYCTKHKGDCDDPNYQLLYICSLTCGVCKGWECVDLKYADYCTAYKDKCDTEPQVKADCPKTCGDCACKNRRDYCVDENKHYCDDGAFKTACTMTCGVCPQSGGPQVAPLQNEISLIGKPTSQSSTHDASQSISDHAVVGNTNGYYFSDSCTHTGFCYFSSVQSAAG
ncbi:uncharacterized protein [Amphiura filiformis]|uniref:uncharacterized protein n=1 Tax=Amphiura filiformis TaxID=82378 RepID=UPI003B2222B9